MYDFIDNLKKGIVPSTFMVDSWLCQDVRMIQGQDFSERTYFIADFVGIAFCIKKAKLIKGHFSIEVAEDKLKFREDEPFFYTMWGAK